MIANVYGHPNPTPALEDALRGALLHMAYQDGHVDSKHRVIFTQRFRYENDVMKVVAHIADEGGVKWKDKGPYTKMVADAIGYTVPNALSPVREAVSQGLISATVRDGGGWLAMTDYGWEILEMWERMDNE